MSVTKAQKVNPSSPAAISRLELKVQKPVGIAAALWEVLWVRRAWPTVKAVAWIGTYPYNLWQPLEDKIWLLIPVTIVVMIGTFEPLTFVSMCIAAYMSIGIALSVAISLVKLVSEVTEIFALYIYRSLFVDIANEIREVLDEEDSRD
jgi:hypothetical protein